MQEREAVDRVEFLASADSRAAIVGRLLREGPASRASLRDELAASRSTITRSLHSLIDQGWVTDQTDRYRLTPAGRLVGEAFFQLVDTVQLTDELGAFLAWSPLEEFELDIERLREAQVVTPSDGDPLAPARRQSKLLSAASSYTGLLPALDLEGSRLVRDRIVNDDLDAEIIITPEVKAAICADDFAELYREMLATGRLTVRVADDLPFYLGIADTAATATTATPAANNGTEPPASATVAQIGVEDEDGLPRALVETADGSVCEWAATVYDRYREAAAESLVAAEL